MVEKAFKILSYDQKLCLTSLNEGERGGTKKTFKKLLGGAMSKFSPKINVKGAPQGDNIYIYVMTALSYYLDV